MSRALALVLLPALLAALVGNPWPNQLRVCLETFQECHLTSPEYFPGRLGCGTGDHCSFEELPSLDFASLESGNCGQTENSRDGEAPEGICCLVVLGPGNHFFHPSVDSGGLATSPLAHPESDAMRFASRSDGYRAFAASFSPDPPPLSGRVLLAHLERRLI